MRVKDGGLSMKRPELWAFPHEGLYRAEIEARLAEDGCRTQRLMGAAILLMQVVMIAIFAVREGGPFATPRRAGYVRLYITLIVFTVVFLLLQRHMRSWSGAARLRLGAGYAGVVSLWACAITALDQFGGNGLVVFSYMIPALAALIILSFRQSLIIFGGAFLVLNVTLVCLPDGMHNLFSNLVNSFALCTLSILIARRLYLARSSAHYGNIIIGRQYEEIAAANRRLEELAVTDQLTGLNNRRYLEQTVRRRLDGLRGGETPVAGLMVDIDFFKQYNDRYGHVAGDSCLRAIAGEIRRFAEQGDVYAVRYGGEEFFLCWIGCGRAQALEGAERLRAAVAAAGGTEGCVPVTVSIGLCVREPWGDTTLEDFVRLADAALYRAKAAGRNRTVLDGE